MDPALKAYFKRVLVSFMFGFIWLFIIAIAGAYFNLAFFDRTISGLNIAYYLYVVVSTVVLVKILLWKWAKPIEGIEKH